MRDESESLRIIDNDVHGSIGIIISILVILITFVVFIIWRRRSRLSPCIVFVGLSDSGKTVLFARLLNSKYVCTYTSAKENIGDILIGHKSLRIVDIPGHEGLRHKYLNNYKWSARGIIFVIDSLTVQKNIRDVAEYLYTVLSDSTIRRNVPSILILCNKQDEAMAKGSTVIMKLLEKEINILRLTQTSQLESIDSSSSNFFLGRPDKDFEFADLAYKVRFAESSAIDRDPNTVADIRELSNWLNEKV